MQFVILKVYDILGNEIETIVNEEKPSGTYELTWNAANLPAGVYIYKYKPEVLLKLKRCCYLNKFICFVLTITIQPLDLSNGFFYS